MQSSGGDEDAIAEELAEKEKKDKKKIS